MRFGKMNERKIKKESYCKSNGRRKEGLQMRKTVSPRMIESGEKRIWRWGKVALVKRAWADERRGPGRNDIAGHSQNTELGKFLESMVWREIEERRSGYP